MIKDKTISEALLELRGRLAEDGYVEDVVVEFKMVAGLLNEVVSNVSVRVEGNKATAFVNGVETAVKWPEKAVEKVAEPTPEPKAVEAAKTPGKPGRKPKGM